MAASQIFHTGGRRWVNQILNGTISRPANLYLILRTLDGVGGHPADAAAADTLTSNLAEVSGAGYSRIAIAFNSTNFPETLTGADSLLTAAMQTFTFTGAINGITHAGLATTADNSGVLICSSPLGNGTPTIRNVVNTDVLNETYKFQLSQGS